MILPMLCIKDLCEMLEGSIANKYDVLMVIDANAALNKRRCGKSTLGFKIARRVKARLPFNPKRDLLYSRKDAIRHLALKKFGIILNDEMANAGYKRDFWEREQIDLIKQLNMYADSYNIFIMIIGDFWDLDTDLRKLVTLRLTILERGLALVNMPVPTVFGNDPWDRQRNQRVENEWSKTKGKKPNYARLSTCVGVLKFGDLTPEQREEYEAIKKEKRGKVGGYGESAVINDPDKLFYDNIIKQMKEGKVTSQSFQVACDVTGRDAGAARLKVNRILKTLGDTNRFSNYVMTKKQRERKDILGYELPFETKKQSEQKEVMNEIPSVRFAHNNAIGKDEVEF